MYKTIYLAGGCFWGMQAYFSRLKGVLTEVGYANGDTLDTDYKKIKETNHAEVIKIVYDPLIIRTAELIDRFFEIIDPFSKNRQKNDVGIQYRSGIFYPSCDIEIKRIANLFNNYIEKINNKKSEVIIEPIKNYVKAEEYHQDYLLKNPDGYCHINFKNVNDSISTFKKLSSDEIKKLNLDEKSYNIMIKKDTEEPHESSYNLNYSKGLYIDKISKEPLFLSDDKYDAGCGWPSFTRPIFSSALDYNDDFTIPDRKRTEVVSKIQNSHLGHVFPAINVKTETGLRYCINGYSLCFIEYDKLKDTPYEKYQFYFKLND